MANTTNFTGQGGDAFAMQIRLLQLQGNFTALRTIQAPVFVDSPEMRGTTTILWSCLVTLVACIYTALHLNVPGETGKIRTLLEKGKWVIIGLIAPEVVLYLASSQFLEARRVAKELTSLWQHSRNADGVKGLREDGAEDEEEEEGEDDTKFDIKYGFFVTMGGMEVSIKNIENYVNRRAPRATLESGSLRSKIDDKSKADTLQKFLVMTQVLWMALQCIVRKTYGLPLCLLEVHTMVHVTCALVKYAFWIKKPKDLTDPELVDSSAFDHLVALMVQEQFNFRKSEEFIFYPNYGDGNRHGPPPAFVWIHNTDTQNRKFLTDEEDNIVPLRWVDNNTAADKWARLATGEVLPCGLSIVARSSAWEVQSFQRRVLPDWYPVSRRQDYSDIPDSAWIIEEVQTELAPPTTDLSPADILRWERVIAAVEEIDGKICEPSLFHPHYRQVRYPNEHYHDAFTRNAGNIRYTGDSQADPDQILAFIFKSTILLVLLLVLPAMYGGIHLLVANFEFPSPIERLLWKIASFDIICTMPAFFLLTYVGDMISKSCFEYDSGSEVFFSLLYKLPGSVLLFVYVFARVFLVVESFISLRAVPIGVYWTPSWIQMLPHV